ncbi:hypothetical protein K438DRAFT_1941578 [Mycena galopus ATCC 62051]|nr:hypothetical protein K438DRAFT_1941578 [Mycena galopus ATCC 62051]
MPPIKEVYGRGVQCRTGHVFVVISSYKFSGLLLHFIFGSAGNSGHRGIIASSSLAVKQVRGNATPAWSLLGTGRTPLDLGPRSLPAPAPLLTWDFGAQLRNAHRGARRLFLTSALLLWFIAIQSPTSPYLGRGLFSAF